jgi:hypothetical protein
MSELATHPVSGDGVTYCSADDEADARTRAVERGCIGADIEVHHQRGPRAATAVAYNRSELGTPTKPGRCRQHDRP